MATVMVPEIGISWPDDDTARAIIESLRWPSGPACVHCGSRDVNRITSVAGSSTRKGVFHCPDCRGQFTVTTGTAFEDTHIPLGKWLVAIRLMASSKKGISAHQLHRMLKMTYRSAWFMAHRIRYMMAQEPLSGLLKLEGIVEVDETYVGGKMRNPHIGVRRANAVSKRPNEGRSTQTKTPVLALVQRGGNVRSQVMPRVTGENIRQVLKDQVSISKARIMTDGFGAYVNLKKHGYNHESVDHAKDEYVRGDVHTNTVEGYFSIFKRGLNGVYHHVGKHHLHRYLAEFDYRYNTRSRLGVDDQERTRGIVKAAEGKRLTYKPLVSGRSTGGN
jgi:transposase-like protein